jgi:hypothetical protein
MLHTCYSHKFLCRKNKDFMNTGSGSEHKKWCYLQPWLANLSPITGNYPVTYVIYRNETVKQKEALYKVFIFILILIDFSGHL